MDAASTARGAASTAPRAAAPAAPSSGLTHANTHKHPAAFTDVVASSSVSGASLRGRQSLRRPGAHLALAGSPERTPLRDSRSCLQQPRKGCSEGLSPEAGRCCPRVRWAGRLQRAVRVYLRAGSLPRLDLDPLGPARPRDSPCPPQVDCRVRSGGCPARSGQRASCTARHRFPPPPRASLGGRAFAAPPRPQQPGAGPARLFAPLPPLLLRSSGHRCRLRH